MHISPTDRSFHSNSITMMFLIARIQEHQKSCNLVQWMIWCGHLAVKSTVHATANYTLALWRAVFKPKCCGKLASRAATWCQAWESGLWIHAVFKISDLLNGTVRYGLVKIVKTVCQLGPASVLARACSFDSIASNIYYKKEFLMQNSGK